MTPLDPKSPAPTGPDSAVSVLEAAGVDASAIPNLGLFDLRMFRSIGLLTAGSWTCLCAFISVKFCICVCLHDQYVEPVCGV